MGDRIRARNLALAMLLLVAPLLAGCIGSSGPAQSAGSAEDGAAPAELPDPVTVIEDAAGDATRHNSHWAYEATPCAGTEGLPGDPPGTCEVLPADTLDRQEPVGAVPAHPARDILDVHLQETPSTLNVSMDVAELNEDLDGAIQDAPEGWDGTVYAVGWQDPDSGCEYFAVFLVNPDLEGLSVEPLFDVRCFGAFAEGNVSGPCKGRRCTWAVPFDIDHGAPATLTWSVPRTMLAAGGAGDTIPEPFALTQQMASDEGVRGKTVWTEGPIAVERSGPNSWDDYFVDRTEPGTNFTFSLPREKEPIPKGPVTYGDDEVRVPDSPDRPDLRIDNLSFIPQPDRFVLEATLHTVAEEPKDHSLTAWFAVPRSGVVVGYVARDGDRQPFANRWDLDGNPVSVPVTMSAAPGEPGRIRFEVLRADLPRVPDGAWLHALGANTQVNTHTRNGTGAVSVHQGHWRDADFHFGGPLVRIPSPDDPVARDDSVRFADAPGDVDPPRDLTETPKRWDLLGTEVVSPAPDEMRFAITVDDLSDLSPPSGYDAVFYAVAVEHPNGRTMLGHYRSRDRPGGEFLCAPDTTVMTDSRSDPTHTAWSEVEGSILTSSTSGESQGTGSGASGSIVLTAGPSCFGLDPGAEKLNVTSLKTGSYLIQRPGGQVGSTEIRELDSLQPEGGGDFETAFADPPPTPAPSFLAQPFGITNFWDIFGGALAVITVAATAGLWLRRRRTFKSYLAEVRRIQQEHRSDPKARATALVELRRELYEDLERHRISDSHYPIVLDRIRARLTSARLTSIGRAFYDLPTHLALRIEAMLDDGHLAEEECAVLEPIIEESGMGEEDRELLEERLRRWVAQDRKHLESGSTS